MYQKRITITVRPFMSAANPLAKKLWIAVRFILFGCVGFCVFFGFALAFARRVFAHDRDFISPFLSLPLAGAGAFMMLFGVGEWRRWAYLLVFLSISVAFIGTVLIYESVFPGRDIGLLPFLAAGVTAFITLAGVRGYYERRARGQAEVESHDDITA